jgi:hypothetical protein
MLGGALVVLPYLLMSRRYLFDVHHLDCNTYILCGAPTLRDLVLLCVLLVDGFLLSRVHADLAL